MKSKRQCESTNSVQQSLPIQIYFDGSGCRPNGEGSGFAWVRRDTSQRHVEREKGLTNNQAEYRGFLAALQQMPDGSDVEVFSDSQLICSQFTGDFRVKDSELQDLLSKVQAMIASKRLKVTLQWVPRSQNLAGKLL